MDQISPFFDRLHRLSCLHTWPYLGTAPLLIFRKISCLRVILNHIFTDFFLVFQIQEDTAAKKIDVSLDFAIFCINIQLTFMSRLACMADVTSRTTGTFSSSATSKITNCFKVAFYRNIWPIYQKSQWLSCLINKILASRSNQCLTTSEHLRFLTLCKN